MADLRGKRAHFPHFDGVAWHSVLHSLSKSQKEPCKDIIKDYFSEICAPGIEEYNVTDAVKAMYTKNCYVDGDTVLGGEVAALRALVEEKTDVAFISINTVNKYQG